MIHDHTLRAALRKRIRSLRPDSPRVWGRMTIDQMLWHVNIPLSESLGDQLLPPVKAPIPKPLLRWLVLNIPWPRGAKTSPALTAAARHDFEAERAKCIELLERAAAKDVHAAWHESATFGQMTGTEWSRLHAKHLDHHLRQFSA